MSKFKTVISKLLKFFPDYYLNLIIFIIKIGYFPNIKNPRSLSEKTLYLKLYERNPLSVLVADRIKVREYVAKKNQEVKFPRIFWHGQNFTEKKWHKLTNEFILKGNHGSGMVYIVNKERDSYEDICKKIKKWLNLDYDSISREWFYAEIDKYVIAEELLVSGVDDNIPPDYKFFCFNGKVKFVQVDSGRFGKHTRNIYDVDFNLINVKSRFSNKLDILKPNNFESAVKIAEDLSADFKLIRVDLFLMKDGVYFGELTNSPAGGFLKFTPKEFDFKMGEALILKLEKSI